MEKEATPVPQTPDGSQRSVDDIAAAALLWNSANKKYKPMPRSSLHSQLNKDLLRLMIVKMSEVEDHEVSMYRRRYLPAWLGLDK